MKTILVLSVLLTAQLTTVDAQSDPSNWPEGWERAYLRFQAFADARDAYWPSSKLALGADGLLTFEKPAPVAEKSVCGMQPFRKGYTRLASYYNSTLDLSKSFKEPQLISICVRGMTRHGYLHFPPLLHVQFDQGEDGKFTKKVVEIKDEEDLWPNWRGFQFEDFHEMAFRHGSSLYESNRRVVPEVRLQIDKKAGIRRVTPLEADNEQLLIVRIYRNGKRIDPRVAPSGSITRGDYGPGHYMVFFSLEGPDGYMPVSNFLTYFIYPENDRVEGAVIFAKDTDGDEISDYTERYHQLDPHQANEVPSKDGIRMPPVTLNYWEFIPGELGERPWLFNSDTENP